MVEKQTTNRKNCQADFHAKEKCDPWHTVLRGISFQIDDQRNHKGKHTQRHAKEEPEKVLVIVQADGVVNEGAVVIKQ